MAIEGNNVDGNLLESSSSCAAERDHGHFFLKKTFAKPTYCHSCCDLLWGILSQGYCCEVCNYTCHEKCREKVFSYCSGVAMQLIKNPVAHSWSENKWRLEKKFCCVCRRRCEDREAFECEVCEYYVHGDCRDLAVSDCKEAATGSSSYEESMGRSVVHHHWREGNLPQGTKCSVCRKSCYSLECLAGMRCQWCQIAAHAGCYKAVTPSECDFGVLRKILLPPASLTIPRTELPMEQLLRIRRKERDATTPNRPGPVEEGNSGGPSTPPNPTPGEEGKEKEDCEIIRIYDGNGSLDAGQHRSMSIPKESSVEQIRDAALRTFHMIHPATHYRLSLLLTDDGSSEEELTDPTPLKRIEKKDGCRIQLFLRYNDPDPDSVTVRVHGGWLRIPVTFCSLKVGTETSSGDLIRDALVRFGLDPKSAHRYNLVRVSLDKGVVEQTIEHSENLLELVHRLRRESLREWHLVRFYLQEKEDPHGSTVSVFIGNLPKNLNQRQYERILIRLLGADEPPFTSIGPIYYEYGSLVVTFNSPKAATKAVVKLSQSKFEDKALLVLCLPNIHIEALGPECEPLMVLVNVKSGGGERGGQGWELIRAFRKLLNPFQVFDVINGGPLVGLYVFRKVEKYRILVCGGDGTVGWVLQCLDNAKQDAACFSPPCGIVPLGTGNDLARVLNWGGGHTGTEDTLQILRDTIDAEEIRLDRWTVVFREEEHSEMPSLGPQPSLVGDPGGMNNPEEQSCMIIMNNYFGIGIDASVCLEFHLKRVKHPERFRNRLVNKGYYGLVGMQKMMRNDCSNLQKKIRLDVNGRQIALPQIEGIIILNIMRFRTHAALALCGKAWGLELGERGERVGAGEGEGGVQEAHAPRRPPGGGGGEGRDAPGEHAAGHPAGHPHRPGRPRNRALPRPHPQDPELLFQIKITTMEKLAVQVDGEPHLQAAGTITILKTPLYATMLRKASLRRLRKCRTVPGDTAHTASTRRSHFRKFFPGRRGKSLTRLDNTWETTEGSSSDPARSSRRRYMREAESEAGPSTARDVDDDEENEIQADPESLTTDIFL